MVGWVILNSDFVLTGEKTSRLILNCKQEATAPTDGPGGFMKSFLYETQSTRRLSSVCIEVRYSAVQTDKAQTLISNTCLR